MTSWGLIWHPGDRHCRNIPNVDHQFEVPYDILVFAVGAINNTFNIPGVQDNAFFLKVWRSPNKIAQWNSVYVAKDAHLASPHRGSNEPATIVTKECMYAPFVCFLHVHAGVCAGVSSVQTQLALRCNAICHLRYLCPPAVVHY